MTAPSTTGDGDEPDLSAADEAIVAEYAAQLAAEPSTTEPTATDTAIDQHRRYWQKVMDGYRALHTQFGCWRAAGFTTDQALRLIAYTIAARC